MMSEAELWRLDMCRQAAARECQAMRRDSAITPHALECSAMRRCAATVAHWGGYQLPLGRFNPKDLDAQMKSRPKEWSTDTVAIDAMIDFDGDGTDAKNFHCKLDLSFGQMDTINFEWLGHKAPGSAKDMHKITMEYDMLGETFDKRAMVGPDRNAAMASNQGKHFHNEDLISRGKNKMQAAFSLDTSGAEIKVAGDASMGPYDCHIFKLAGHKSGKLSNQWNMGAEHGVKNTAMCVNEEGKTVSCCVIDGFHKGIMDMLPMDKFGVVEQTKGFDMKMPNPLSGDFKMGEMNSDSNMGDISKSKLSIKTVTNGDQETSTIIFNGDDEKEAFRMIVKHRPEYGGNGAAFEFAMHQGEQKEKIFQLNPTFSDRGEDQYNVMSLLVDMKTGEKDEPAFQAWNKFDRRGMGASGIAHEMWVKTASDGKLERAFLTRWSWEDSSSGATDQYYMKFAQFIGEENNPEVSASAMFSNKLEKEMKMEMAIRDKTRKLARADFQLLRTNFGENYAMNTALTIYDEDGSQSIMGADWKLTYLDNGKTQARQMTGAIIADGKKQGQMIANFGADNYNQKYYWNGNVMALDEDIMKSFISNSWMIERTMIGKDNSYTMISDLRDGDGKKLFGIVGSFATTASMGLLTFKIQDPDGKDSVSSSGYLPRTGSSLQYFEGTTAVRIDGVSTPQTFRIKASDGFIEDPAMNAKHMVPKGFTKFELTVGSAFVVDDKTQEKIDEETHFYVEEAPPFYSTEVCGFGGHVKIAEINPKKNAGVKIYRSQSWVDIDLPIDTSTTPGPTTLPDQTTTTVTTTVTMSETIPMGKEGMQAEAVGSEVLTTFESTVEVANVETFDAVKYKESIAKEMTTQAKEEAKVTAEKEGKSAAEVTAAVQAAEVKTDSVETKVEYKVEVKYEFDNVITPALAKQSIAKAMDVNASQVDVEIKVKTRRMHEEPDEETEWSAEGRRLSIKMEVKATIRHDDPVKAKAIAVKAEEPAVLNKMVKEMKEQGVTVSVPKVIEKPKTKVAVATQVTSETRVAVAPPKAETLAKVSKDVGAVKIETPVEKVQKGIIKVKYIYVTVTVTVDPRENRVIEHKDKGVTPPPSSGNPGDPVPSPSPPLKGTTANLAKPSAGAPAVVLLAVLSLVATLAGTTREA